jgi:hypothetical protein
MLLELYVAPTRSRSARRRGGAATLRPDVFIRVSADETVTSSRRIRDWARCEDVSPLIIADEFIRLDEGRIEQADYDPKYGQQFVEHVHPHELDSLRQVGAAALNMITAAAQT